MALPFSAFAGDKEAMNYSNLYSMGQIAATNCGNIEFDGNGAVDAIRRLKLTDEDVQKAVELFAITKPIAEKRLAEDGLDKFCGNAMVILGTNGQQRIKMLKYKDLQR